MVNTLYVGKLFINKFVNKAFPIKLFMFFRLQIKFFCKLYH